MFSKIRSLIFKLDPELSHTLAIKALKFNYISINNVKKDSSIETSIFGKKISNPVGVAAGFDKDAEVYNPLFRLGFGFVEVGTITPLKQYGNPKPRIFRLEEDEALINRLGFNSSGADIVSSRIRSNSPKGLFGINIGPNKDTNNKIEDYLIGLRKFYDLADYLTINISSPNTENLRSFHNQNELDELLNAIQKEKQVLKTEIPIAVKVSPDIEMSYVEKIAIIGVGGVDSGRSAYEKIINGASLVQLYTGMVYKGPNIASKISNELIKILKNEEIKNISEVVGSKN